MHRSPPLPQHGPWPNKGNTDWAHSYPILVQVHYGICAFLVLSEAHVTVNVETVTARLGHRVNDAGKRKGYQSLFAKLDVLFPSFSPAARRKPT